MISAGRCGVLDVEGENFDPPFDQEAFRRAEDLNTLSIVIDGWYWIWSESARDLQ